MWHEIKEFLRREIKPHTKGELIDGVQQFWKMVDVAKCKRYVTFNSTILLTTIICKNIRHLAKVIPKVIEVKGEATGY